MIIVYVLSCTHIRAAYERFLDYRDFLVTPGVAYDNINPENTNHRYYIEFNDRFFKTALDAAMSEKQVDITKYQEIKSNDDTKRKVSAFIEKVFNRYLPVGDPNIFNVVSIDIEHVHKKETQFVVEAKSLIHRENKIYGLLLHTRSYHDMNSSSLLNYDMKGFIFEDKIYGNVLPSNLHTDTNLAYDQIMMDKIMQSKEFEQETYCKYLKDLKIYNNMEVPEAAGCV